jgi:hypothetical protein
MIIALQKFVITIQICLKLLFALEEDSCGGGE